MGLLKVSPDLGLDLTSCVDDQFLTQNDFVLRSKLIDQKDSNSNDQSATFLLKDKSREIFIRIRMTVYRDASAVPKMPTHHTEGTNPHFSSMISKFASGSEFDIVEGDGILADLRGRHEFLNFDLTPIDSSSDISKEMVVRNRNRFEALVRHVYSRLVAARTTICPAIVCGSSTVSARMNQFGNQCFLNLNEWAKARSWTVAKASDFPGFVLSKGTDFIKLPIGAHECFWGDKKVPLGDAIIDVDGTFFVPESIDSAIKN